MLLLLLAVDQPREGANERLGCGSSFQCSESCSNWSCLVGKLKGGLHCTSRLLNAIVAAHASLLWPAIFAAATLHLCAHVDRDCFSCM